ncbi:MAG: DUF401 family protein [bacterium]|nr:DUF401 family protein [bacterium]
MLPLIKLLIVVFIFIFLVSRKLNIGLIMLFSSLLMGIFFLMSPMNILKSFATGTFNLDTLKLLATVYFTLTFGHFLKEFGYFNKMKVSLEGLIHNRNITIAIPPIIVGFIPMPAGAMLSAPMVEEAGKGMNLSPELKTYISYWFRHPWEYCWPVYLGMILASSVLSMPVRTLSLNQYPLSIAIIVVGIVVCYIMFPKETDTKHGEKQMGTKIYTDTKTKKSRNLGIFFLSILPILLVFVFVVVAKLDVIIALAITVIMIIFLQKPFPKNILPGLKSGLSLDISLLLVAVMIFKKVLENSGALTSITQFLGSSNASSLVLLAFIPFIVGFLTGVTTAFVGIAFPMLMPLLHNNPTYVMFAYAFGFAGVLLSPVHLCLAITKEYFKANLWGVYKMLIPSTAFVMFVAIVMMMIKSG